MSPLLYILVGFLAYHFFSRYLRMAASLLVLLLSIAVAYRVTAALIPEIAEVNWRGFWSGAGLGTVAAIVIGALWFYVLGWRARVAATEQDDIDRARQKAAKDRQIA